MKKEDKTNKIEKINWWELKHIMAVEIDKIGDESTRWARKKREDGIEKKLYKIFTVLQIL